MIARRGFNLGVEHGQLAVVCATLPALFLLRGKRWYFHRVMPLLSLAIVATATTKTGDEEKTGTPTLSLPSISPM